MELGGRTTGRRSGRRGRGWEREDVDERFGMGLYVADWAEFVGKRAVAFTSREGWVLFIIYYYYFNETLSHFCSFPHFLLYLYLS